MFIFFLLALPNYVCPRAAREPLTGHQCHSRSGRSLASESHMDYDVGEVLRLQSRLRVFSLLELNAARERGAMIKENFPSGGTSQPTGAC